MQGAVVCSATILDVVGPDGLIAILVVRRAVRVDG